LVMARVETHELDKRTSSLPTAGAAAMVWLMYWWIMLRISTRSVIFVGVGMFSTSNRVGS
jgi:hypothetical protein